MWQVPWYARLGCSRALIVNTLCSLIGAALAANVAICWRHRHALAILWRDLTRLLDAASRWSSYSS